MVSASTVVELLAVAGKNNCLISAWMGAGFWKDPSCKKKRRRTFRRRKTTGIKARLVSRQAVPDKTVMNSSG